MPLDSGGTFVYTPPPERCYGGHADAVGDLHADGHDRLHHGDSDRHADSEQGHADDHLGDAGGDHYGTALSATQLDATATVAGTFAYTPAAGTVLRRDADALGDLHADRHDRLHHGYSYRHADGEQGYASDHLGHASGDHLRNGAQRDAT